MDHVVARRTEHAESPGWTPILRAAAARDGERRRCCRSVALVICARHWRAAAQQRPRIGLSSGGQGQIRVSSSWSAAAFGRELLVYGGDLQMVDVLRLVSSRVSAAGEPLTRTDTAR